MEIHPVSSPNAQSGGGLPLHGPAARVPNPPVRPVWPDDLLEAFCLRMASQGMCVSRALMQNNRQYGLEQLAHAHNMADDRLRAMAVQLFQSFVTHQSGIAGHH